MKLRILFILITGLFMTQQFKTQQVFSQQTVPIIPKSLLDPLKTEVSGEIGKDFVYRIAGFDRIQASPGYAEAANYIMDKLKEFGYRDAHIEKYVSNGSKKYYTWTPPMGWRIKSGELWMVKPVKKRLACYEEIATSVVKGSQSANVTAEVLALPTGTNEAEYKKSDVKGKIIMAPGYTGNVHRMGVLKYGAAGVITHPDRLDRIEFPDMVKYTALWPTLEEQPKTTFGFNISRRDAEEILAMLDRGEKVVVHAELDAEDYESQVEDLVVTLPGTEFPDQELIIMGHLCHYKPGANDNASGCAGMLEIARALKKLIEKGEIPPLKRTVRFLWVPEWNGTMPWIHAHPDIIKNTLAGLNFDMIGNDLAKTKSYFNFTKTPHSLPSYLNDLTKNMTEYIAGIEITTPRGSRSPWNYRIKEYSGGSDHWMFCDGSIAVPVLMFNHPDPYHHIIQDTPDNIDPTEMKRTTFLGASILAYLANAGNDEASALADLVFAEGTGRIAQETRLQLTEMDNSAGSEKELYQVYKQSLNRIEFAVEREKKAVMSSAVFADNKTAEEIKGKSLELEELGGNWIKMIENRNKKLVSENKYKLKKSVPDESEKKLQGIVVKRTALFTGPLEFSYLTGKLGAETVEGKIRIGGNVQFEAANFMDGKRDLLEIYNAVSAEYGPQKPEDVMEFIILLEKAGLVRYIKK